MEIVEFIASALAAAVVTFRIAMFFRPDAEGQLQQDA